ncbi:MULTISPECIES: transfer protein [unclassified Streptomyces]|uniref:transfer protein n=1 Tax=unclassified Streptomyces TaxID=2593676 RepID=UPI002E289F57|nr:MULTISPECIES: transfer protein [unclassified Streptomyces]
MTAETIYELTVEAPPGDLIVYDPIRLASALRIDDPSRLAIETDGMNHALVTIYPSDPLADVELPDPSELAMDDQGRIWVGRYHNGRPARMRLYDPKAGSAQRGLLFGTTGAGKSTGLQIILAAEKRSGICTWLADLKGGQSVPEARDNVDWFVTTQEGAMAMLRTAWLVMQERQRRYSAMGRSKFLINRPDPLIKVRIDEANRLLEKGAPFRDEATYYIKDIGRTGRSLGMGIDLSAQAGHLEELGGSDTLRGMLKDGEVILLRWTSTMMRQLVSDGLLAAGQALAPIPKYAGATRLVSQFEEAGEEDLPGTQGSGYLLSGSSPTSRFRFFNVGSTTPVEGLDPEILALYGDGPVRQLEEASWEEAGGAYAGRLDGPEAYAAIFPMEEEDEDGEGGGGGGGRSGGKKRAASPVPAVPQQAKPRSRTLAERVQAVLEDMDDPIDAHEVLAAVNADGGREVRLGSVRNTLTALKN